MRLHPCSGRNKTLTRWARASSDRGLLERIDRNLLHMAHASLSRSVCAAVGIGELRDALEERLENDAEPFFCHGENESELTRRLQVCFK